MLCLACQLLRFSGETGYAGGRREFSVGIEGSEPDWDRSVSIEGSAAPGAAGDDEDRAGVSSAARSASSGVF